jgi:hypothetical protein
MRTIRAPLTASGDAGSLGSTSPDRVIVVAVHAAIKQASATDTTRA